MKQSIIKKSILALAVFGSSAVFANQYKGLSFNGSSGLYVTPSAIPLDNKTIAGGIHYLSEGNNFGGKVTAAVVPELEFGMGLNTQSGLFGDGLNIHGKYRLSKGETNFALYGNFMHDPDAPDPAFQMLGLFTQGSVNSLQINGSFGYTFQPGHNGSFDFSLGVQRVITSRIPWLLAVVDFSNYGYFYTSSALNPARGIFNVGGRGAWSTGRLNIFADLVLTEFLDGNRGLGVSGTVAYKL
jgi:hypothetical protein